MNKLFRYHLVCIIFLGIAYAQSMEVSGASTDIVNGTYLPSILASPQTNDDVFYYIKEGSPTLYLLRANGWSWHIAEDLSFNHLKMYYYKNFGFNIPDTPDGIYLDGVSWLGSGPNKPTVNASTIAPEISVWVNNNKIENRGGYDLGDVPFGTSPIINVRIENNGNDDLILNPLPTVLGQYSNYFIIITPPASVVPPSGNTTFVIQLIIPTGLPRNTFSIWETYIEIINSDVDNSPFKVQIGAGSLVPLGIEDVKFLPNSFMVLSPYPNPFNPSTTITYGLDKESEVYIQIHDINGKLISTLNSSVKQQGWHSVKWHGTDMNNNDVPAGLYFCKIIAGDEVTTTKLMLIK